MSQGVDCEVLKVHGKTRISLSLLTDENVVLSCCSRVCPYTLMLPAMMITD